MIYLKSLRGNYDGYFAIITEEGENLKNVEWNEEIEIIYLKKSFGKLVVTSRNLDSRLIADLKKVTASVHSWYWHTITDMWLSTGGHHQISL